MSTMALTDQRVQVALSQFLDEARICARTTKTDGVAVLGFAAMLTAFACVLGVGEALCRHGPKKKPTHRISDCESIRAFCDEMMRAVELESWLRPPVGEPGGWEDKVSTHLINVRNNLVHAVSLTERDPVLCPNFQVAEQYPNRWVIVVPAFVDAVEQAMCKIVRDPQIDPVLWDSCPRYWQETRMPVVVEESGGSVEGH